MEQPDFLHLLYTEPIYAIQEAKTGSVAVKPETEGKVSCKAVIFSAALSPAEKDFLEKILAAVNTETAEVFITDTTHIPAHIHYDKTVSFGMPLPDLKVNLYEKTITEKGTFLLADSLSDIQADVTRKKKLWTALQQLFLQGE